MSLVVLLNLVLIVLFGRAAYMATQKYWEYRGLPLDATPAERALVLDQVVGWTLTSISKAMFLVGGFIIFYYAEMDGFRATDPTDYVIPLYILGFLFLVVRQEMGAWMVQRRYRMLGRDSNR